MAVPTISALSPVKGHTAGRMLVEITGTNFRLPVIQAEGETDGIPLQSLHVWFGDEPAIEVSVATTTRAFAVTPIHDPGSVDVRIQNVENDGTPIVGEEATAIGAFEFVLPRITTEDSNQSDLQRVVRTLIAELQRQVVTEVTLSTHTDYDPDGNRVAVFELANLPGISLAGPFLSENRFYSLNENPCYEDGLEYIETEVPYTVDLEFDLFGVSDRAMEMLNLMTAVVGFFRKNKVLRMYRIATDPSAGRVEYEIDFTEGGEPKAADTPAGNSNLHSFSSRMIIRGFDIEDAAGLQLGLISGTNALQSQVFRRGGTLGENGPTLDPVYQLALSSPPMRSVPVLLPISGLPPGESRGEMIGSPNLSVRSIPSIVRDLERRRKSLVVRAIFSESE